jgi:dihydroflavonol-4-reductase
MPELAGVSAQRLVVVTGATGHIGNVLVRELLARREPVRAVLHSRKHEQALEGLPVEKVILDIRNPAQVDEALRGATMVFHLAGMISISPGMTRTLYRINVNGTRNVIQACRKNRVQRLVYASSTDALVPGMSDRSDILDEQSGLDPSRVMGGYARSKARATLKVLEAARDGLDCVVVYPSAVVGPFDFKPSQMGQLILDFARRRLPAYLDGAYNFVDVRDVVSGLLQAAEKGAAGEGYLLTGSTITVPGLMALLAELTGVRAPWLKLPYGLARFLAFFTPAYYALTRTKPRFTSYSIRVLQHNCEMTNEKACRELDYSSRPLRETLADSIAWFRQSGRLPN